MGSLIVTTDLYTEEQLGQRKLHAIIFVLLTKVNFSQKLLLKISKKDFNFGLLTLNLVKDHCIDGRESTYIRGKRYINQRKKHGSAN